MLPSMVGTVTRNEGVTVMWKSTLHQYWIHQKTLLLIPIPL